MSLSHMQEDSHTLGTEVFALICSHTVHIHTHTLKMNVHMTSLNGTAYIAITDAEGPHAHNTSSCMICITFYLH